MRLSGLASGMDTETMIKDLMKAERLPLDKLTQKKTYLEWQLDDYRTVNRQLNDFSTMMFDGVMKQSTFIQKNTSTSNPDALSVRNISSVSNFTGSISIQQLAEQATMRSRKPVGGSTTPIDVNAKLTSLGNTTQTIKIRAIKEDGTLQTDAEMFSYTFDPTKTSMQDVLNEINKSSNIAAFYDSFTNKISITAKHSGNNASGNEIELTGTSETFLKFAGFEKADGTTINTNWDAAMVGFGTEGKNSKFTYNGLVTERSSNTFNINGVEFNLKQVTTGPVTFSSTTDTDKILESVVKFVDEYNKLIEDLNAQVREPKYRDYQPLTDEQKNAMEEKQIEMWEEKAKSGTLRNDSIISGMLNEMRFELQGSVAGSSLAEIGIKPSSNYRDHGKLVIDEAKLREVINSDPNKIYEMFAADGETQAEKGFARRIRETVDESRKEISARAGSAGSTNATFTLGRNLESMNEQISRFEDRLRMVEDRYWRQFTAMETAIQRANMQSAQLMSAFGGGA